MTPVPLQDPASDQDLSSRVEETVRRIRERAPGHAPRVALLLGSGWGAVADRVESAIDMAYGELPAFPHLGVGGHRGVLRMGLLAGKPVVVLLGRQHAYETGDAQAMKGAIRTLAALGCQVLLQTNAAGSLDVAMQPGECMVLSDHLNLTQRSPLFGETGDDRFVDMADAYDPALREVAHAAAKQLGLPLHEGVFAWMMGPQFETPAEIRMLRTLGAQAVGMSTVPETILARHAGMRVVALSLFTNLACGLANVPLSHSQTLVAASDARATTASLVQTLVAHLELP
jgi:purine-nucleoside phosphorylase